MKNIFIFFIVFTLTITCAVAQVISFNVDALIFFEHSADITTGYAIRHNQYKITGESHTKLTYSFDLDNMILTHTDKDGKISKCSIIEKNVTNDSLKTFNAIFITSETHEHVDVILSTGTNPKDGIVVYFRMNERTNGIVTTKGCFQTNVKIK